MLAISDNEFALCVVLTTVGAIGLFFATIISHGRPACGGNLEIPYGSLISLAEMSSGVGLAFVLLDPIPALAALAGGMAGAAALTRLLGWAVQGVWLIGQVLLIILAVALALEVSPIA